MAKGTIFAANYARISTGGANIKADLRFMKIGLALYAAISINRVINPSDIAV